MVEEVPVGLAVGDRSQGYEVTGSANIAGLTSAYRGKDTRDRDDAVTLIWLSEEQDQSALFGLTSTYEALKQPGLIGPRTVVRFGGGSAAVFGKEQGAPLEGETLERWLTGRPPLSLGQAAGLMELLMNGLQRLHERGMAHGRLSAQLVLIDGQGQARLLAPVLPHGADARDAYVATQAPELVSGGTAGPVSDVYSLCALLRWMITGTEPISADARLASKAQHDKDPLEPIDQTMSDLPADVARMLDTGLRLHPATRPQSIASMVAVLEPHKQEAPKTPPPLDASSSSAKSPWSGSSTGTPPPLPTSSPKTGSVPPVPKRPSASTIGQAPPPLPNGGQGAAKPKRTLGIGTVVTFIVALGVAWFVAGGFGDGNETPEADRSNQVESVDAPRKGPQTETGDGVVIEDATDQLEEVADGVLEQFCNSRFTFQTARDAGTNALQAYLRRCQGIDSEFVDTAEEILGLN